MLLHQWDVGAIRLDSTTNDVVVDQDAVSWYRGVIGERVVGSILELLSGEHTVLHSVPVGTGSSDIDHVVVGRAGVFTINTKYSPGKAIWSAGYGLLVDGHKTRYVSNSVAEARRAADLLSLACGLTVPVTALLVFVNPGTITRKAPAGGGVGDPEVRVIADQDLLRVFMDRPIFSEEQVARIATAAVRAETWHRSPVESTIGHHITREFEALEEEVGPQLARAYPDPRKNIRPARTAAARAPRTTAPPRARSSRSRTVRRRRSALEKIFRGLMIPVAGLIGLWLYLNSITGK